MVQQAGTTAQAQALAGSLPAIPPASASEIPEVVVPSRLAPPPSSRFWSRYTISVVAPNTATGSVLATLGAATLAAAEGAARFQAITVYTPLTTHQPVAVFQEQVPDGSALRVAKLGLRVHSSMRAIRFIVLRNAVQINTSQQTPAYTNTGQFEPADWGDLEDPMDFYLDMGGLETITIAALNLDPNGGYLVETLLQGWLYSEPAKGAGQRAHHGKGGGGGRRK